MEPTLRLYWDDDHCFVAEARVVAIAGNDVAFDRTCFYAGGGGQPPDAGTVQFDGGDPVRVVSARADEAGVIWHTLEHPAAAVGQAARLQVDPARRLALTRYHTVLHVLNTIALQDYGAWITGVQIGVDYSRIDFKWEGFTAALCPELEAKVNRVLEGAHALRAYYLDEADFRARPDLLRTLEVNPPVVNGRVRVVEIEGFDAQACGGTHVPSTAEVGRFTIYKTENKGKINKRLYVRLS
jgi:misacylated tRNA(Ala) deacylase